MDDEIKKDNMLTKEENINLDDIDNLNEKK